MRFRSVITTVLFAQMVFAATAAALPKYGPDAVPLSRGSNLQYFKTKPAPDFWALMPFYVGQQTGRQCSAASFTMVLNAARKDQDLSSDDKLVTIQSLLEQYSDDRYKEFMSAVVTPGAAKRAFDRSNVANARLAEVLGLAARRLEIASPNTRVDVIAVDLKNIAKSRKAFHDALVQNEKSANDFMILSFMQNTLTGDPETAAHVAPVGAYDAKKRLVLILDPDRQWYEPYWAPEDKVFDAVADPRSDYEHPGWLHFQVK